METVSCIVCGDTASQPYLTVADRFSSTSEKFKLVKCSCGFVYLNPRPDSVSIGPYYDNPDYDPHSAGDVSLFTRVYRIVQKAALFQKRRMIEKYISAGSLLDIGGGQGEFCQYMIRKGWKATLQDQSIKALALADSGSLVKINSLTELPGNNQFDLITMWHALEHIHDVQGTFDVISRFLKPKGLLVIAVPNRQAPERQYYKEKWAAWDAPRHLYHFSIGDLEKLIQNNSFKAVKKIGSKQYTPYNMLLSIPEKSLKSILSAGFILVNSCF